MVNLLIIKRMFVVRAGPNTHAAGTGGSRTYTLWERAVMVRNPPGGGRSGIKKTVPRKSLVLFPMGRPGVITGGNHWHNGITFLVCVHCEHNDNILHWDRNKYLM